MEAGVTGRTGPSSEDGLGVVGPLTAARPGPMTENEIPNNKTATNAMAIMRKGFFTEIPPIPCGNHREISFLLCQDSPGLFFIIQKLTKGVNGRAWAQNELYFLP